MNTSVRQLASNAASNGTVRHTIISVAAMAGAVLIFWWRVEAQINGKIEKAQAPVAAQVSEVKQTVKALDDKVDKVAVQQGQIVGKLDAIAGQLQVRPPYPVPTP
jgi:multidrug efflux pump subunit AcrA (membrane-fusion protein)